MKVAVAQINPTVGDVEGNLAKMLDAVSGCVSQKPDLVLFPELSITGYPPKDLLDRRGFIRKAEAAVRRLVRESRKHPHTGIIIGAPTTTKKGVRGLHNSAILIHKGRILFTQHKTLLPNYDVFDEARYFDPADRISTVEFKGEVLGLSVCEDAWNDPAVLGGRRYEIDPLKVLAEEGATLLVNISASPYRMGKEDVRFRLMSKHARKHGIPLVFVNQVGGNDELVFDGASMCFDGMGRPTAILPAFREHVEVVDTKAKGSVRLYGRGDRIGSLHDALVLGIRDYMGKCGFTKAVLGLSGGIDSAVTACLAAEAVGADNVLGVTMPGPYSSKGSITDSQRLAENLGIHYAVIPINGVFEAYVGTLREAFDGTAADKTEENIQARIRGNILMALSNKYGHLVLSTGNKSELAVGYCTLYGDMSGGLAALSDVPKTLVYRLARYINKRGQIIPMSSIKKPPSAELKANQTDQDTLPPYDTLDRILQHYVDRGLGMGEIIAKGFDRRTVEWVVCAVNRSEYKRRQAPPGLKVTTKAFGSGRRMPIAAKNER